MNLSSGLENLGSDSASLFIVVLLAALTLMAFWSSATRQRPSRPLATLGPRADGVYLSMRFRPLTGESLSHTGHVTALNLGTATFVSPRFLARGDEVELDFGTLPGYPAAGSKIVAKVHSSRSVGSESSSYMVTVKLPTIPEPERAPLSTYILQLAGGSRLSPA